MDQDRAGGCRCGAVRFSVSGDPTRVGICHCTDCRQESGSAFTYYGIWPRGRFQVQGTVSAWKGRSFCPGCGSPLFSLDENEAEVKLGALDEAPTGLVPSYELWTIRREPWFTAPPAAERHERDRPEQDAPAQDQPQHG